MTKSLVRHEYIRSPGFIKSSEQFGQMEKRQRKKLRNSDGNFVMIWHYVAVLLIGVTRSLSRRIQPHVKSVNEEKKTMRARRSDEEQRMLVRRARRRQGNLFCIRGWESARMHTLEYQ